MSQKAWAALTCVLALIAGGLAAAVVIQAGSSSRPVAPAAGDEVAESSLSAAARIMESAHKSESPAASEKTVLEIATLRVRVATAERERDQYKVGLEQAVAELNRVSATTAQKVRVAQLVGQIKGAAEMASASSPQQPREWRKWEARVSSLGEPMVQILGQQILVTGTLWNSGDVEAQGRATVTLRLDNRPIDTRGTYLTVPARSEASYSQMFNFPGNLGTYSATVSFQ
jgi:hypothetical protein